MHYSKKLIETCIILNSNYNAVSVISKQFELIEMSNKNIQFLNIDNVPYARISTYNSFHSRGSAAANAKSPAHFFVKPWCNFSA